MNVFDILGPVMIGPSSSHTAGAARIGLITRKLLADEPVSADIIFHGSFAHTYKGHGTDRAVVAGILGMKPDNNDLRNSLTKAKEEGVDINISTDDIDGAHPNTAIVSLKGKKGSEITLQGSSIGGGNIVVNKINGMDVYLTGQLLTLIIIHQDTPGEIAYVTELLADTKANICNFHLARKSRGGQAVMTIEIDNNICDRLSTLKHDIEKLPGIDNCTVLAPIG